MRFGAARFVFLQAETVRNGRAWRLTFRSVLLMLLVALAAGFSLAEYLINQRTSQFLATLEQQQRERGAVVETSRTKTEVVDKSAMRPSNSAAATVLSTEDASAMGPVWLERINYWRTVAKVPRLAENPAESAGAKAHARYVVENYLSGNRNAVAGSKMHTEDPGNPWTLPMVRPLRKAVISALGRKNLRPHKSLTG